MFQIGEFSKIAQVPASLLRYYDEIGLFKPIKCDQDTSYRFYSVNQLTQLNRIIALKDLGLTLEQIKLLVKEEISAEEIRGMLTLKKSQIEQTIQEEAMRLKAVESRLQQLERKGQFQDDDVVLKSLPAQSFLSMRHSFSNLSETLAVVASIEKAVTKQIKTKSLGRFVALIHSELYQDRDMDLEFGFLLNRDLDITIPLCNGMSLKVRQLPAVETAVTAVRYGGPEQGHLSYGAIGTWAEKHHYKLINPGREMFIVPPKPGHESEIVVEIQLPVETMVA
ncbi:MAG: MerR family transcriptional regulator [Cyanobacteria bacterium P01_C01_bin.72]